MNRTKLILAILYLILVFCGSFNSAAVSAQTPMPTSQVEIPPDIFETLLKLSKELQTANEILLDGQRQMNKSKADALPARAKLLAALGQIRAVSQKAADKLLLEKINQSGTAKNQALSNLTFTQMFAKSGEAIALNAIANTHSNLGEWRENVEYLKAAVAAYQDFLANDAFRRLDLTGMKFKKIFRSMKINEAIVLTDIAGTLEARLGQPAASLVYFNQGLERLQALQKEQPDEELKFQEAVTLSRIGMVYGKDSQNKARAIEFLMRSIGLFRSLPDKKSNVAFSLDLLATYFSRNFDYESALKNWQESLQIYRETNDKEGQRAVLQSIGVMYFLLDNQTTGREYVAQVLEILNAPDYVKNYQEKRFQISNVQEVYNELSQIFIEENRFYQIGYSYELLEQYQKAVESYKKALTISRTRKEDRDIRLNLRAVASIYSRLKDWSQAAKFYAQALEISRAANFSEEIAVDLAAVGWTLFEAGDLPAALRLQNEALTIFQTAGVDGKNAFSISYSPLLNDLARTYNALGNPRMAIFYGKRGINAIQIERQKLSNFDAESQKGFLRKKEKNYRRLADWLINAGRIAEAEEVLALLKDEEVFAYLRRDDKVAKELLQIVSLTAEERAALTRYDLLAEQMTKIGKEFGELDAERKKYDADKFPQQARYDELKSQLADANAAFQKFLDELKIKFGQKDERVVQIDSSLQKTLERLKTDKTAIVSTIVGENRLNLIVTTSKTQRAHTIEIGEQEINKLVAEFRAALTNPNIDPRPAGQKIYDVLIRPIEADLAGIEADTIVWSLDGTLRYIPTAALWDKEKGYLAERFANAVITLASRETLALPVQNHQNWQALGVGVSKSVEGFSALNAVPDELDCIVTDAGEKTASNSKCQNGVMNGKKLLDEKFTLAAFENALGRFAVVHIASHFRLNPGNDKDSFLLLGGGETRKFTVEKLRGVSLTDVELIVLSACNTATPGGEKANGVEIEGFGAVAQKQGAKSVMATLWSVADDSTRDLMVKFYELYSKGKISKAEAMRQAQIALLNGNSKTSNSKLRRGIELVGKGENQPVPFKRDNLAPFAHPYFWSPFILIGNWR